MNLLLPVELLLVLFAFHMLSRYLLYGKHQLAHESIINFVKQFERIHGIDLEERAGICFGLSMVAASYYGSGNLNKFNDSLFLLRDHKTYPSRLINAMKKGSIDYKGRNLEDLKHILIETGRSQSPGKFSAIFGKKLWQPDINEILAKINTQAPVVTTYGQTTQIFESRERCAKYLESLEADVDQPGISLIFSSFTHAIWCCQQDGFWCLLDSNTLFQQNPERAHHILTSKQLSDYLFAKMKHRGIPKLTINLNCIGPENLDYNFDTNPEAPMDIHYLAMASVSGDIKGVQRGIGAGINPFALLEMEKGSTPLTLAIAFGRCEVVKEILPPQLAKTADTIISGRTVLHFASKVGAIAVLAYLLELQSIPVNAQDDIGLTALMLACSACIHEDNTECIALLLNYGANPDLKSNADKTARDYVRDAREKTFFTRYAAPEEKWRNLLDLLDSYSTQQIPSKPLKSLDNVYSY